MNEYFKIPFNSLLNKGDTEKQTYGCRANNPDICANNMIENICVFSSYDFICKKPSRAWKKKYDQIAGGKTNGIK